MKTNEIIGVLTELLNSIPTKMLKATITFSVKNIEGEYSAEVKADNLNELLIGLGNTGNYNTGNWNTGDLNTGNRNAGNQNTGDLNTGNQNTGNWNTGDLNTGNQNTGNWNTGNYNTGDFNKSNWNTGYFNTETHPLYFFDKFANVSYYQWATSKAHDLLYNIQLTEWIYSDDMTEEEKKEHPDYEIMGGYLKSHTLKEACDIWWNKLSENEKEIIKTIPNFNPDKFYEITGIRVEE